MKAKHVLIVPTATAALALAAPSAQAISFDFYKLDRPENYPTDFRPDGTVGVDFYHIDQDNVSSDVKTAGVFNSDLQFSRLGGVLTATATGTYTYTPTGGVQTTVDGAAVQDSTDNWNDTTPNSAGLGVYHDLTLDGDSEDYRTSDDNITTGETLKIAFNHSVALSSIKLRAEGHNITNWESGATFEYSLNGTDWVTKSLAGDVDLGTVNVDAPVSLEFYFRYGGGTPDQFYLAAMDVYAPSGGTDFPMPDGGTTALLLAMSVAGLGAARRRVTKG